MAKSQETYNKKEKEKKRLKKRQDKNLKMEERKANPTASGLDAMMAYVDENGHIVDTPPDPSIKKKNISLDSIEISVAKRTEEEQPAVRVGRIDFFNHQKGFGFIKENETQEKYFVHVHGLLQDVDEGNAVSFELERGMKGMNAVRVKKI